MNQVGTNHHFVPQSLLRNFAFRRKNQYYVHVFDKKTGQDYRPNVRNVASEIGFYDLSTEHGMVSYEPTFSTIESSFKSILNSILKREAVSHLTDDERQVVAGFAAIQMMRTRQHREDLIEIFRTAREGICRKFGQDALPLDWPEDISPEQAKDISITSLAGSAFKLLPYLIGKSWMILKTEDARPFYISDHPVVLQNLTNPGDTVR